MSLCRDIIFLCRDRVMVKARRFLVMTIYFRSQQTLAKTKGPYVATKQLCRDRVWLRPRNFMSRQKYFMSRHDFIE